jgi:hypothetical protein
MDLLRPRLLLFGPALLRCRNAAGFVPQVDPSYQRSPANRLGNIKVAELEDWLKRTGGRPREVALRQKVRSRLGG